MSKKGSKIDMFLIIEDPLICSDIAVLSLISKYYTFFGMEIDDLKWLIQLLISINGNHLWY